MTTLLLTRSHVAVAARLTAVYAMHCHAITPERLHEIARNDKNYVKFDDNVEVLGISNHQPLRSLWFTCARGRILITFPCLEDVSDHPVGIFRQGAVTDQDCTEVGIAFLDHLEGIMSPGNSGGQTRAGGAHILEFKSQ